LQLLRRKDEGARKNESMASLLKRNRGRIEGRSYTREKEEDYINYLRHGL
jgi:hypothetical protein